MKFTVVIMLLLVGFLNLGKFLDITHEAEKSDVIVSLGGNIDRSAMSINLFKESYSKYNKFYFVGVKSTLIKQMKVKNIDISMLENNIIYVQKMKNTMDEITYIDHNIANKYNKIIIVTDPPHSRRVDFLIKYFSKNLKNKYIMVSSQPKWWDKNSYFLNQKAFIFSIQEVGKIFYNYMKYAIYLPFTNTL